MERLAQALTFLAALGSGLMAGLFFIFSITIMASLAKLTPANGIAAMQSINVTILGGTFLSVCVASGVPEPTILRRLHTPLDKQNMRDYHLLQT